MRRLLVSALVMACGEPRPIPTPTSPPTISPAPPVTAKTYAVPPHHVASLKRAADDGGKTWWHLVLHRRPTEGCLALDDEPTAILEFEFASGTHPTGTVTPSRLAVYPKHDPVPAFEHVLVAGRIEIIGGALPKTADGIGHGDPIGSVKLDIQVPGDTGSLLRELPLIDCHR